MRIVAERGKVVVDGSRVTIFLRNVSIEAVVTRKQVVTVARKKAPYGTTVEFAKEKLKELRDRGVEEYPIKNLVEEYQKTYKSTTRTTLIKRIKRIAGFYGFNVVKHGTRLMLVRKRVKSKARMKSGRDWVNVFKVILSNVQDRIKASDVLKRAKVVGGYYYKLLRKACEEQGFSMRKENGVWWCVRKGRKPRVIYRSFSYEG